MKEEVSWVLVQISPSVILLAPRKEAVAKVGRRGMMKRTFYKCKYKVICGLASHVDHACV